MISSRLPAIASERMPSLPRPVSIPTPPSKVSVAILPYPLPRTRNEPGAAVWVGASGRNTPADRRRSPRSLKSGNYRTGRERRDGKHEDDGDRRFGVGGPAGRAEGRRLHAR